MTILSDAFSALGRISLVVISGLMILLGVLLLADGLFGHVIEAAKEMLEYEGAKVVFLAFTGIAGYCAGIVNVAVATVIFARMCGSWHQELVLIATYEQIGFSAVLKDFLELLHLKRTMQSLAIPMGVFGLGLIFDRGRWQGSGLLLTTVGVAIILGGIVLPILAGKINELLKTSLVELEQANKRMESNG